jgi:hypothetical protein
MHIQAQRPDAFERTDLTGSGRFFVRRGRRAYRLACRLIGDLVALPAARTVIDPGEHRGEGEKDTANGNRKKK